MNVKHEPYRTISNIILIIIIAVGLVLILTSCHDARYMVRYYDRMEAGQPVDSVYLKGGGVYEIN